MKLPVFGPADPLAIQSAISRKRTTGGAEYGCISGKEVVIGWDERSITVKTRCFASFSWEFGNWADHGRLHEVLQGRQIVYLCSLSTPSKFRASLLLAHMPTPRGSSSYFLIFGFCSGWIPGLGRNDPSFFALSFGGIGTLGVRDRLKCFGNLGALFSDPASPSGTQP